MKSRERKRHTWRITRTVLAILILYTSCWLPFWCINFLVEFGSHIVAHWGAWFYVVAFLAFCLNYFNSAFNPIIYVFLSDTHRQVIVKHCFSGRQGSPTALQAQVDSRRRLLNVPTLDVDQELSDSQMMRETVVVKLNGTTYSVDTDDYL